MSSTLSAIKARNDSRISEEKRSTDRKKHILVMILDFLRENSYLESALTLQSEVGSTISKYTVADNIDLPYAIKQFEEYQEIKVGKRPTLVRRLSPGEENIRNSRLLGTDKR